MKKRKTQSLVYLGELTMGIKSHKLLESLSNGGWWNHEITWKQCTKMTITNNGLPENVTSFVSKHIRKNFLSLKLSNCE